MKCLPLTKGFVAIVDDEDYDELAQWTWCADVKGGTAYAARRDGQRLLYMHRALLAPEPGLEVDHLNHIDIDNRRCNLRAVPRGINSQNRRTGIGRSEFVGVT